jgi:hypothetical protein
MAEQKFLNRLRVTANNIREDASSYISRVYNRSSVLFTTASPFAQIISVLSDITELLMFYIEDSVVEQNIYTAQHPESVYGMSRLTGHDATRGFAAFGEIQFRWKPGADMSKIAGNGLVIDGRSEIKFDTNGMTYTLLTPSEYFRIDKSNFNKTTIAIIQGEFETQTFTSTGEKMQSFNVKTGFGLTDHNRISVSVNGEKWTKHNSLYDILAEEKGYLVKTGISAGLDVYFGNGNFGMIPQGGATIEVEYLKHNGSAGNVSDSGELTIKWKTTAQDSAGTFHDLNELLDVTVTSAPKMGADRESIDFTKILTPMASKSFVLATPDNYEYFLSKYGIFSYIDAYNTTDDEFLDDDNVIYIFAMPDMKKKLASGDDYFSMPEREMFFADSEYDSMLKVLQDSGQMMVTTEVSFVKPQVRKYSMDIDIRYFEGFSKNNIFNDVRGVVSEYLLNITRRDKLPKSDIVYILEQVEGIDSVNVRFISETEETARRLGYYESITKKVQPQEPVLLEDIGNGKQKYIFFKTIETVNKVLINDNTVIPEDITGLDQWGDIIMEKEEVAVFRGGWQDRDGDLIEDDVLMNEEAALSINFDATPVPRTIYTRVQAGNRKALK